MKETYETKDLYEASLIYAKKIPLIKLDWQGDKCFFVFDDKASAETLSQQYWNGSSTVNARNYATAIRQLKERIFSRK